MYTSTLPLLATLPLAFAQYGYNYGADAETTSTTSTAASSTSTSISNKIVVNVGKSPLTFEPSSITASVGQILEFHFFPNTHSVAQSNFSSPCNPLPNEASFFSGGVTTDASATSGLTSGWNSTKTFQIRVNDTSPIWFYCGYPGHCSGGMVGVANQAATGNKTLEAYKLAAKGKTTVSPAKVQGGVLAAALSESASTSSAAASPTTSSGAAASSTNATSSGNASAGIEGRGAVRWTLLGLTGLVAIGVGSLMA